MMNIDNVVNLYSQNNRIESYGVFSGMNIRELFISNDSLIQDITDLGDLDNLNFVQIQKCVNLTSCSSTILCDILSDPNYGQSDFPFILIHYNAVGCNNNEEILEKCTVSLQ